MPQSEKTMRRLKSDQLLRWSLSRNAWPQQGRRPPRVCACWLPQEAGRLPFDDVPAFGNRAGIGLVYRGSVGYHASSQELLGGGWPPISKASTE